MNTETTFTFDLIFSYWLDAWFVLWLISNTIPNPAVFLAIGLSQNWWFLSKMFYLNLPTKWLYLGQSVLLKLIPLCISIYALPKPETKRNIEIKRSTVFGLSLTAAYTMYLWIKGTTPWDLYSAMNKSILSGETKTPFMKIAKYL